jgi:type I restriction-modification system DNA methylase subunit
VRAGNGANLGFEEKLWAAGDKLRGHLDATEYKHGQLFYTTQIPVCLWVLTCIKKNGKFRDRRGQTLFIDARKLGQLVDRTHRELTEEEIARIGFSPKEPT